MALTTGVMAEPVEGSDVIEPNTAQLDRSKRCLHCKELKAITEFRRCSHATNDGHRNVCKVCSNAQRRRYYYDPQNAAFRFWLSTSELPAAVRSKISLDVYQAMLEQQGGVCAICGTTRGKRRLVIDHDHKTNEIRGLLCGTCNTGLGSLGDDLPSIERARQYLLNPPHQSSE